MIGRALAFAGLAADGSVAAAAVVLHGLASMSTAFSNPRATDDFWQQAKANAAKSGCPGGRHRQGTSSNTATQPREHPREETAVAHPQPISVYIDSAATHTGRPRAVVDRVVIADVGQPRLRIHLAGLDGPFISMTPDHWAILSAEVTTAIEDARL